MASRSVGLAFRWAARAWSILSLIAVLIFAVGEGFARQGPGSAAQGWVSLALFPFGVCLGLALAWYREGFGGILALACLVAFYGWSLLQLGHLPSSPIFLLVGAPSILFIVARFESH